MIPQPIYTNTAPEPIGPYSQAVACGDLLFISGQIAIDPTTGVVTGTTVEEQSRQVLTNLKAILRSQGLDTTSLVKTTVFLRDITQFAVFNEVYAGELGSAKPARSVVEVSGLPKAVLIELEAVACR